ncbi:MAG: hypothetical protein OWU33_00100 [Firmicutes bacterium]|nr:hypothetical protein [Bacillota bacterium]
MRTKGQRTGLTLAANLPAALGVGGGLGWAARPLRLGAATVVAGSHGRDVDAARLPRSEARCGQRAGGGVWGYDTAQRALTRVRVAVYRA